MKRERLALGVRSANPGLAMPAATRSRRTRDRSRPRDEAVEGDGAGTASPARSDEGGSRPRSTSMPGPRAASLRMGGRTATEDFERCGSSPQRQARRILLQMSSLSGDRITRTQVTGTDHDRQYKFKWLLGTDGSKRRFAFFVIKYLAFFYASFLLIMQYMALGYLILSAQRWGWLLHGKSFYLPHHTPVSMRKTGMSYRNLFFTIAQRKGYSHRDIERMILLPTNSIFELSPLGLSTKWRPSEASIEEAIANNQLPTDQEVSEAMGEIKDVRSTTAAAAAAAAAQAAGGDGKLAAFTLQLIDSTFKQVWPSAMFEAGEGQPFVRIKGATRSLLSSAGPVTFIVFPGVVSEMIEVGPFGELPIWEDSTFAKLWKARLAECGKAV